MKNLILGLCLVLVAAGAANAAVYTWFGGVGDWETDGNWDTAGVPTLANNDTTHFLSGVANVTADSGCLVPRVGFGIANLTATIDVNAGATWTTGTEAIIGFYAGENAKGVLDVHGTANLPSLRVAGEQVGSAGDVNIDGGLLKVTTFGTYLGMMWVPGDLGVATVNISNGGVFQVDGMGAHQNRLDIAGNGSSVNLLDATSVLKLLGDRTAELQNWIDLGRVTGRTVAVYNTADNYTYAEVPEPATMLLISLGGLFLRRKRA